MAAPAEAFLFDHLRTPRGKGKAVGSLHEVKPVDLIVGLLREIQVRNPSLDTGRVDDVVLGVVTPIGEQGGDIAKTAALVAGYPETVAGVQLNRFCASGLEAVNQAAARVRSGFEDLILAGGVESMSRVPMGSDGGAWAADPATALTTGFVPQGIGADLIATLEGWSREDVDAYAAESHHRAAKAWANGYFADAVVPVRDVNGGAIAMGHPLGATGAMLLGTLVDELRRRDLRRGLATLCIGGGMGVATIVELV
jgi:acetyl-CoA C-acetyltransferase